MLPRLPRRSKGWDSSYCDAPFFFFIVLLHDQVGGETEKKYLDEEEVGRKECEGEGERRGV
jgi:hypothetical protein